jgi:hypothetical protein
MHAKRQYHDRVLRIGIVLATGFLLAGCGGESKPFTIGVVSYVSGLTTLRAKYAVEGTDMQVVSGVVSRSTGRRPTRSVSVWSRCRPTEECGSGDGPQSPEPPAPDRVAAAL